MSIVVASTAAIEHSATPVAAATSQFTLFEGSYSHRHNAYAQPASTAGPTDWKAPTNYYQGRAYLRLEVTSKPTNLPVKVQLCMWRGDLQLPDFEETCSPANQFSSVGTYWFDLGAPSTWWKKNGIWDFTQPFSPTRLMIKDAASGTLLMTSQCGAYCYSGPEVVTNHVPILMNAHVIVVAKGSKVVPPESWVGCPAAWSPDCPNVTNNAPVVNAGADQAGRQGGPIALAGTATDDGRPASPGVVTTLWSVVSGPGDVVFDDPTAAATNAAFSNPGTYELQLNASDGAISANDITRVTVIPEPAGGNAVLVASKAIPTASDVPYVTWLTELGYTVTVVDDNGLTQAPLDAADLVVISASVTPASIPTWIAQVDSPLLSSEPLIAKKLGLGATGVNVSGQTRVNVVGGSSPLAAGFSGLTTVARSTVFSGIKNRSTGVETIANAATQGSVSTIAAVDAGVALPTGTTSHRRVGFFLGSAAPPRIEPNGRSLFDAAIAWLHPGTEPTSTWWDTDWRLRVPIALSAGGSARVDAIAEAEIDLTAAVASIGEPLSLASLRVVEVTALGVVLDEDVPFQFDPATGFDATSFARGHLTVLASGNTPAATQRRFHVYFDGPSAGHAAAVVPSLITVENNVMDEGQSSYRVTIDGSQWVYQKQGGGFSSLLDDDGDDWLSYSTAVGSAGEFRGMPNAAFPQGHFHPGKLTSNTVLVSSGPLRVVIESSVGGNQWRARWEFFPHHARMTMVTAADDYWFLYEGTPGGSIDAGDSVLRPGGVSDPISGAWSADLSNPEWAAFSDAGANRSLVVAHPTADALVDSYRLMNGEMTVFGFGRQTNADSLVGVHEFVVSFTESSNPVTVAAAGLAAATPPATSVGGWQPVT